MTLPQVVSPEQWQIARDELLVEEKRATRALDALAAKRRRLPMVRIVPWYSSAGSDFNVDFGLTSERGETFGLSAFLRDGDDVYRTYVTSARGVDRLRIDFNLLDLSPLGRQEAWEDSPAGWPQTAPYEWWRLHDEYAGD